MITANITASPIFSGTEIGSSIIYLGRFQHAGTKVLARSQGGAEDAEVHRGEIFELLMRTTKSLARLQGAAEVRTKFLARSQGGAESAEVH
jgi:hypothetical protein